MSSDTPIQKPHAVQNKASTQPTTYTTSNLSQEADYQRQRDLFFIGLEMLGEKKKKRFLLYLLSLQTTNQQNQETQTDELQNHAA